METIKVVAESLFHGRLEQAFRLPAEEGYYYRCCPNPCDDKKVDGIAVHCGCGWPVSRVNWRTPKGWKVDNVMWIDRDIGGGRNNIAIHIVREVED